MPEQVAVTFPGQGTQRPGMGAPWQNSPAWRIVEQAQQGSDLNLADLLLEADADTLARTENAQTAVFLTSLMAWDHVEGQVKPVAFAGHSLGQITALVAAGACSLADGLRLAAARAAFTQAAADDSPGAMVALIAGRFEDAVALCDRIGGCWVANDNAPGQLTVAGTPEAIEQVTGQARSAGFRKVIPLPVTGAFHTPLMSPASARFGELLKEVNFADTDIPIIANSDARPHANGTEWPALLEEHLVMPVRWRETMNALAELTDTFVEVGHGDMIKGLARVGAPTVRVLSAGEPGALLAATSAS